MTHDEPAPPADLPACSPAQWPRHHALLLALTVSVVVSFVGVFDHAVWTPDEPRVAEIGREMLVNGDYVVPTLAGEPFLEKPPLYWWGMAGLYHLFGVSDGVARTTSALAGVLTLLLVYDVTRRVSNPFAGLMGMMVTATMVGFFKTFHRVLVDPWLVLFVMLGYWAFVVAAFPRQAGELKKRPRHFALAVFVIYLAGGLSFLCKGLVGPGLLGAPIVLTIVLRRRWDLLRHWVHVPGGMVFLALCALWPALLYERGGVELMSGFTMNNLLYRFFPPEDGDLRTGHVNPPWYYLKTFAPDIMPWAIALPAVCHWFWRRRLPREWNWPALVFLGSVYPVGLCLLSVPGTKRVMYLVPLMAPLGAVIGAWIAAIAQREHAHKIDRRTQIVQIVVMGLTALAVSVALLILQYRPSVLLRYDIEPWIGPRAVPVAILMVLLIAVEALLLGRAVRRWMRRSTRVGPLIAWATLAFFVLGGSAGYLVFDGVKSLHKMTADLVELDAFSPALVCYNPDEVTQGILPYDTGIIPEATSDPADLARWLGRTPPPKVLTFERHLDTLPQAIRSRLQLLKSWRYSKRRIYGLYEVAPAAGARPAATPGHDGLPRP